MPPADRSIPAPLAPIAVTPRAVGRYGPTHVDAEDFSRRLGNWGGASQLIGERWEVIGLQQLRRRLPWTAPLGGTRVLLAEALLALDADPASGRVLQRAGVSAPDLLLVGRLGTGGRPLVRAVDCKVSLDTAELAQTAPTRLQATLEKIRRQYPSVAAVLREQVAALPDATRASAGDTLERALAGQWNEVLASEGLFVAPDSGFNRWFVSQLEQRRRTGAPLGRLPAAGPRRDPADLRGPVDAARAARLALPSHLEPVSAQEFLAPLAGWPEAGLVAELDGITLEAVDLAVAERCWRVGVGLRGAALALHRRLFQPAIDATDAAGRPRDVAALLRRVALRRRPADSAGLVTAVAQTVEQRRPLWEREAALLRAPVSFGAWVNQLVQAMRVGLETADGEADGAPVQRPSKTRLRYAVMGRRHRQRVLAAADALYAGGLEEEAVLAELEARAGEWRAAALDDTGIAEPAEDETSAPGANETNGGDTAPSDAETA